MIKNYAHRGFCSRYPENTMLAFEKALAEGVDGIENDVQLTKDGEIIILHDESIDRTTDGKGWVKDLTLAQVKELNANEKFGDAFPVQRIPTLREYLELVKNEPVLTNIEMKTGVFQYLEMEQLLVDLLREYKVEDRILITSFNHFTIMRMKKLAPELGPLRELDPAPGGALEAYQQDDLPHYYLLYPDRAVTLELWSEASRKEIGAVLEAILSE